MKSILAKKLGINRGFDEKGRVFAMTELSVSPCVVTEIKTLERDGYQAIQLGYGEKISTRTKKTDAKLKEKLGGKSLPVFLHEVVFEAGDESLKIGQPIKVEEIIQPNDLVDAIGISKGKGFAGVVKRYSFAGGPRTHGQSDRERAPGSIGSGTTPGRVYKGKRMAGRMGSDRVTVKRMTVMKVDVEKGILYLKGSVPGRNGSYITLNKTQKLK